MGSVRGYAGSQGSSAVRDGSGVMNELGGINTI